MDRSPNDLCLMLLLTGLTLVVVAVSFAGENDDAPTSRAASQPASCELDYFLAHAREASGGLVHIGASDKPILPLLIGIGRTVADTGLHETEVIDGAPRQVAIVCPLSQDEMRAVLTATFDARLFEGAHVWRAGDGNEFAKYLLTIKTPDQKRSTEIDGRGAVAFRQILVKAIRADNTVARHALRLDE